MLAIRCLYKLEFEKLKLCIMLNCERVYSENCSRVVKSRL
nr:MAG TPA: hypothetical protein [Bacteriophage sp.]